MRYIEYKVGQSVDCHIPNGLHFIGKIVEFYYNSADNINYVLVKHPDKPVDFYFEWGWIKPNETYQT